MYKIMSIKDPKKFNCNNLKSRHNNNLIVQISKEWPTKMIKFNFIWQNHEAMVPMTYSRFRKKRALLASIRYAQGVSHLVQKCRDNEGMTYNHCASYLRRNPIQINHTNIVEQPSKLSHIRVSKIIIGDIKPPEKNLKTDSLLLYYGQ